MTAKKRKLIIIIVSAVLAVALILSLSLGLTLGRKEKWFADGDMARFETNVGAAVLRSDVKLTDLKEEYQNKFADYMGIDIADWQPESIFRNYTLNPFFSYSYSEVKDVLGQGFEQNAALKNHVNAHYAAMDADYCQYGNGAGVFGNSCLDIKLTDISGKSDKTKIVYVSGKDNLQPGELIVDKWVYWSVYARVHDISLDVTKVEEILDADDIVAKHVILRNCRLDSFGMDSMALDYFGLLPKAPTEVLNVMLTSGTGDDYRYRNYKIVGYCETTDADDNLAATEMSVETLRDGLSWATEDLKFMNSYYGQIVREKNVYISA